MGRGCCTVWAVLSIFWRFIGDGHRALNTDVLISQLICQDIEYGLMLRYVFCGMINHSSCRRVCVCVSLLRIHFIWWNVLMLRMSASLQATLSIFDCCSISDGGKLSATDSDSPGNTGHILLELLPRFFYCRVCFSLGLAFVVAWWILDGF